MSAKPLTDALSRDTGAPTRAGTPDLPWEQTTLQVDVTLTLLLRMLKRRKWLLILTVLIVPLLTWIATLNMTPLFTASADVIVEPQPLNIANIESILVQAPAGSDVIASQIEILSSRALGAQVIERLQLYRLPEFNPALRAPGLMESVGNFVNDLSQRWLGRLFPGDDSSDEGDNTSDASTQDSTDDTSGDAAVDSSGDTSGESAADSSSDVSGDSADAGQDVEFNQADIIDEYLTKLSVYVRGQSRVIQISYTSPDPEIAARVVNALVDVYLVSQLEAKFDALKRASGWLNERLQALRDQARQSEDAVEAFRAEAGLTQGVQASIVAEQISKLNTQLGDARFALSTAQSRLDQIRGLANLPAQLASLPEVMNFPVIQRLLQEQALLQQRVTDMASKVGERHPDLLNLRAQAKTLDEQVGLEIQRVIRSLEPEVVAARSRVEALEGQLSKLRQAAIIYNAAEAKLRSLQRESETNQGLLQTFLERAKETTDRFELESADARLLANAVVPTSPSHPNPKMLIAASAVVGLLLGLLLVYVVEQLNQTIRSGDDVEAVLGLSCLAVVPMLRQLGGLVSPYDYVVNKPMSAYAEAFRGLRASLWFGGYDRRGACKSVVVTSTRPGEGKTAASISLARVAALAGERVILVDCDVRQPSVGKALKAEPGLGLFDILTGKVKRGDVIQKDHTTGMSYILIGTNTSVSAQLLMSEQMVALVHSLRAEYDLVVLDAPPTLAVSDARILATIADAVVYCVQWRETSRTAASSGLRILRGFGANVAGALLMQVNLSTHARAGFTDSELYSRKYSGYYQN